MNYRTETVYDFDRQNESRADCAEWALAVASDRNGEAERGGVELDVTDLLSHLIHFCERAGLNFDELVGAAEQSAQGDLEDGPETARDLKRFPAG